MAQKSSIDITLSCLCGLHQHTYAFPENLKTLDYFICHCDSCRRSSGGSLYQGAIVWTFPLKTVSETADTPKDPKSLLKHYHFGPILDFWFCEQCSTKMYWQYKRSDAELEAFPGLVPDGFLAEHGIRMSCVRQVHVEDALDEGLSRSFRKSDGEVAPRSQAGSKGPLYVVSQQTSTGLNTDHIVQGRCHCGNVTLKLKRDAGQKHPVEIDLSERSKLLNSVDLSVWAMIDRSDVVSINDMPLHILEKMVNSAKDGRSGPLSMFQGNSIRKAYFCNGCSASVFVTSIEGDKSKAIRIGAGLLNSQSGARAEDILDWSGVKLVNLESRSIQLDPKAFRSV